MNSHQTITLRPCMRQYLIDQLPLFVLLVLSFILGGIPGFPLGKLTATLSLFLSLCLVYRFIYLRRIIYHIGTEQIVCEHGVFRRSVNYMEMYRIVDFLENQSFMQQLFGVKTITILSMDRSTPRLDIIGIPQHETTVQIIRQLAEESKRNKGIYEITNR